MTKEGRIPECPSATHRSTVLSHDARRRLFFGLLVLAMISTCLAGCKKERSLTELESALAPGSASEQRSLDASPAARLRRLFFPGIEPQREWSDIAVAPNTPANTIVELTQAECVGALAVATNTDADLDLVLLSPDGLSVATDDSPDAFPLVAHYCVQRSGVYAFQLRSDVPTDANLSLFAVPMLPGDDALRDLRREISEDTGAELTDETPPLTNALRQAGRYVTDFAARSGHCYHALAIGTDSIHDLDIYVRDEDDETIAQELGVGPIAGTSAFCVEGTQRVSVEFRAHRGAGSFRWQIVRATMAAPPPNVDAPL